MRMARSRLYPSHAFRGRVGGAIGKAISVAGLLRKTVALTLGIQESQLSAWINGDPRGGAPRLDLLLTIQELQWPLIRSLAELDPGNVVTEEIRRRTA